MLAGPRRTSRPGRTRPIPWRLAQMEALDRLMVEREPGIATALEDDLGRSAYERWFGEFVGVRGEIAAARRSLRQSV